MLGLNYSCPPSQTNLHQKHRPPIANIQSDLEAKARLFEEALNESNQRFHLRKPIFQTKPNYYAQYISTRSASDLQNTSQSLWSTILSKAPHIWEELRQHPGFLHMDTLQNANSILIHGKYLHNTPDLWEATTCTEWTPLKSLQISSHLSKPVHLRCTCRHTNKHQKQSTAMCTEWVTQHMRLLCKTGLLIIILAMSRGLGTDCITWTKSLRKAFSSVLLNNVYDVARK